LTLLAEPKRAGRRQAVRRVIRTIAATDGGAQLELLEGRYGPYVTDGETNASIPKGTDPATLSLEEARGLIEARHNAEPRPARRRARGAASRKTAGKGAEASAPKPSNPRARPATPKARRAPKAAPRKMVS
jgi:DNA topoisomerase I